MKRVATVLACCVLWILVGCHKDKPTVDEPPRIIWTANNGLSIEARYSDGSSLFFKRMTDSLHENELTCIGNRFLDEEECEGDGFSVVIPSTIIAKINSSDHYDYYEARTFVVSGIGNLNHNPWGYSEENTVFDSKITSLTLPNTINYIGDRCCSDCSSLAEVVFSEGLTEIGTSAFENCSSLTEIALPGTIRKVGYSAYKGCSLLRSVTIQPGLDTIVGDAFRGAFQKAYEFDDAYVSLVLPDGLKYIGGNAFEDCSSLTTVSFPPTIQKVEHYLFRGCPSLQTAIIRPGIYTIPKEAFQSVFDDCSDISLVLPEGLEYIGERAFNHSNSLVSLTLPDGLKYIGEEAFSYCHKLASLTLPEGLEFIGQKAFTECGSLTSCVCKAVEPPILDHSNLYWYPRYPFDDSTIQAIFVPRESVDAYKAADGWNHYADIIFPIE